MEKKIINKVFDEVIMSFYNWDMNTIILLTDDKLNILKYKNLSHTDISIEKIFSINSIKYYTDICKLNKSQCIFEYVLNEEKWYYLINIIQIGHQNFFYYFISKENFYRKNYYFLLMQLSLNLFYCKYKIDTLKNTIPSKYINFEILTSREYEILNLLLKGKNNEDIARILVISKNTVMTHIRNIYTKLEINSRYELLFLHIQSILEKN